jgi:hypothetical protein
MRLSANCRCPERRSDDGQTILECIRTGLKSPPDLVLLVELSGLEPLTSCMPCRPVPSGHVVLGPVPGGQAGSSVWLWLAPSEGVVTWLVTVWTSPAMARSRNCQCAPALPSLQ